VIRASEGTFPAVTSDRLALVSVSGLSAFRPLYDRLTAMGFYNLNPKIIRGVQNPQDGRLLKPAGENIASVIGHLARTNPAAIELIEEYLHAVVPSVQRVEREVVGPVETLAFKQNMAGAKHAWSFRAQSMSDGTLRTLGILTALFQGNMDHSPSLIGIEEPETALHPAASAALREALSRASEQTQIIVTSHSPDLLDDMSITPEKLRVVVAEEGATRIAPVAEGTRKAIRDRLCSAGELLRLNQLHAEPPAAAVTAHQQMDLVGVSRE
jgi:predicted ATPase